MQHYGPIPLIECTQPSPGNNQHGITIAQYGPVQEGIGSTRHGLAQNSLLNSRKRSVASSGLSFQTQVSPRNHSHTENAYRELTSTRKHISIEIYVYPNSHSLYVYYTLKTLPFKIYLLLLSGDLYR